MVHIESGERPQQPNSPEAVTQPRRKLAERAQDFIVQHRNSTIFGGVTIPAAISLITGNPDAGLIVGGVEIAGLVGIATINEIRYQRSPEKKAEDERLRSLPRKTYAQWMRERNAKIQK